MTLTVKLLVVGLCFLFVLCVVLGFCLRQQLVKLSKVVEICDNLVSALETIQNVISEANKTLDQSPNLKVAFENDDETGVYFSELKNIQEQLNQFLGENEQETSSGKQP